MSKGLSVVLLYVGVPIGIIFFILGIIFNANLTMAKPIYQVEEICEGSNCNYYEEMALANSEICELFGEDFSYVKGKCISIPDVESCLVSNTYLYCSQQSWPNLHPVSIAEGIKKQQDKIKFKDDELKEEVAVSKEKDNVIIIMSGEIVELNSILNEAYPDVIYCSATYTVTWTYDYEISVVNKTTHLIGGWTSDRDTDGCAVCRFPGDENYSYRCSNDGGQWRSENEGEWDHCTSCERYDRRGKSYCMNGEKTEEVEHTEQNKYVLEFTEEEREVRVPENLSAHRIPILKKLKKELDCYTTVLKGNKEVTMFTSRGGGGVRVEYDKDEWGNITVLSGVMNTSYIISSKMSNVTQVNQNEQ